MNRISFLSFIVFLLLILNAAPVSAYYSLGQPQGFVNDYAGILSAETKQALETKLNQFEKNTSNEISVVTIKSLEDDTIENFAVKLFEEWGIGKEDKDNGVLVLIAVDDKKMRVEVGYGLEGALTDAQSFWIIQNIMKPAFQKNDYNGGVTAAVDKIMGAIQGEYVPSETEAASKKIDWEDLFVVILYFSIFSFIWLGSILNRSKSWWAGGVIGAVIGIIIMFAFRWLIGLIAIIILTPLGLLFDYLVSKNYQHRKKLGLSPSWWAGGGFGGRNGGNGGFGGFGGGSSGGGGASGDW